MIIRIFVVRQMVIYTLSSTDPEHFNRIQAKLPTELSSRFVNLCVTSLTSNCNIEVMNNSDYIVFKFKPDDRSMNAPKGDGEPFTICCDMERYSKLTTASLPYILQDLLNTYEIPITASISNLDTLIFTSEIPFEITEMSYNMKLITGFYSYKDTTFDPSNTSSRHLMRMASTYNFDRRMKILLESNRIS